MQMQVSNIKRIYNKVLYKLGLGGGRPLHRPTIQLPSSFHGTQYGGSMVFPNALSADSIVYSFGVGEDATFDRDIMQTYGAAVFAFDPTPKSIEWVKAQQWPEQFSFYPYGIAAKDGTMEFYPPSDPDHVSHSVLAHVKDSPLPIRVPMHRLETIAKMLGHTQIDLLKMDIEGAEYQVLPDILVTPGVEIGQILVGFHRDFPGITSAQTKRVVQQLFDAGYEILYVTQNGNDYSFIQRKLAATYAGDIANHQ